MLAATELHPGNHSQGKCISPVPKPIESSLMNRPCCGSHTARFLRCQICLILEL